MRSWPSRSRRARAASRSMKVFGWSSSLIFSLSSVARRTRLQSDQGLDVILLLQLTSLFQLILRSHPIRIEDLRFWTEILFRLAVAIQAPGHVQRAGAIRQRHLGNLPVTRGATHALGHMNAVIEVNKVGQRVHTGPGK